MHDPVPKVGVCPHSGMETRIGSDDGILFLNTKREIETIVNGMTEIDGQPGGRRGKLAHGKRNRDWRHSQRISGIREIPLASLQVATGL